MTKKETQHVEMLISKVAELDLSKLTDTNFRTITDIACIIANLYGKSPKESALIALVDFKINLENGRRNPIHRYTPLNNK